MPTFETLPRFEMTWDNDGRATFSYGAERVPASRTSSGGASEPTTSSLRRPARNTLAMPLQSSRRPEHPSGIMGCSACRASFIRLDRSARIGLTC